MMTQPNDNGPAQHSSSTAARPENKLQKQAMVSDEELNRSKQTSSAHSAPHETATAGHNNQSEQPPELPSRVQSAKQPASAPFAGEWYKRTVRFGQLAVPLWLIVAGLALLLLGIVEAMNGSTGFGAPVMRVEQEVGQHITVTSDDDSPFTVTKVVVNGRAGEKGCDSDQPAFGYGNYPPLPATLKRGDFVIVPSFACGEILETTIYTDRGDTTYKFNQPSD